MSDIKYRDDSKMVDSGVDWLGLIPLNWSIKKLKYVSRCLDGLRVPLNSSERGLMEGEIPYWGSNRIVDYVNDFLIDDEVILLGEDGAPFFDTLKDVAFISRGPIWINNHIHLLKPINIDASFLKHSLNIVNYKNYIKGSTRDKLAQNDMKQIFIPYTDKSEQKKIANFLDTKTTEFDKIITKKEQLIEKLEEAKKSLISEVVTGKVKIVDGKLIARDESEMKDSGVDEFGKIAKEFLLSKLKFHGDFKAGISKGSSFFGSGYPFVSYSDVYNKEEIDNGSGLAITSKQERISFSLKEKDILFTRTSESINDIGVSSICKRDIKDATYSGFIIRYRIRNKEKFDYNFIKFYFQNQIIKNFFASQLNIVTRASLSQEKLKELLFILPTYEEQKIIGEYLKIKTNCLEDIIATTKDQINKLKQAKQSLISEAVTGKVDLRDWEIID